MKSGRPLIILVALCIAACGTVTPLELPPPAERTAWQPLSLSRPVNAGEWRVEVLRNVRQDESVHVDTSGRVFRYPRAVPLPYAPGGVHIGNGLFLDANGNVAFDIAVLLDVQPDAAGLLHLRRETGGSSRLLEIAVPRTPPPASPAVLESDTLILASGVEVRMPAREWPEVIEVVRPQQFGRDVVVRVARTEERIVVSRSDGSWITLTFIEISANKAGLHRRLMIETSYGSTVYYEPV